MELSPIPGIRAYTAAKAAPADFQLSALADVDEMARAGSSVRSGVRRKAAGTEEMESDDLPVGEDTAEAGGDAPGSNINIFA